MELPAPEPLRRDRSELANQEARIQEQIKLLYVDPTGNSEPILDGIIDLDLYCSSTPRIMWILKEPWDEPECAGGGWSICSDLLATRPVKELSQSTFHPIIYIAYGIYKDIDTYEDIPWIEKMEDPEGILRRLAFINAKKIPGVTTGASDSSILEWFERGKSVIMDQIKSYSPDIIFACGPHVAAILDNLDENWSDRIKLTTGSTRFIWCGDTLIISVYHPGQRTITRERYVEEAIATVKSAYCERGFSLPAPR